MRFTILHMRLMMHYHAIAEPYALRDPRHANSEAVREYRLNLIQWGMLETTSESPSHYKTTKKGEAYTEALKDVSKRFVPDWNPA